MSRQFGLFIGVEQPIVPPRFQAFQSFDKVVTEGVAIRPNESFALLNVCSHLPEVAGEGNLRVFLARRARVARVLVSTPRMV